MRNCNSNSRFWMSTFIAAVIAAWMSPGFAQSVPQTEPESSTLAEVIVTAQRREQNANDVGISLSVLDANAMAARGVKRSEDIVNSIPNVEITSIFGPGTNPNYSVRGVTQNDYNDATEAPIAAYIDDVYLVSTGASSIPLFDMNRVEVLRGPQGTLFGRNSTGGAIQFVSNEPAKVFSAFTDIAYGSYDTIHFAGALNVPLSDKLQARFAVYHDENNGYLPNLTGNQPDGGQQKTQAFRGQLAFEPTDTIRDVLKISYSNTSGRTSGIWRDAIANNPVNGDQYPIPGPDLVGQLPLHGFVSNNSSDREIKSSTSWLFINKLNWNITDKIDLTSITAYNHYLRDVLEDCDGGQTLSCVTHYHNPSEQFSEELRAYFNLGAQRYTLGAYFLRQTQHLNQIAALFGGVPASAPIAPFLPPGGLALVTEGEQEAKGEAIFANAEFDLGEQFTLIVGLRGAQDQKKLNQVFSEVLPVDSKNPFPDYINTPNVAFSGYAAGPFAFNAQATGGLNSFTKNTGSGKLELDYKPIRGQLIYGSVSRGVKAPGYNNGFVAAGLPNDQYLYKQERLTAYEIGWKSVLWDKRINLNTAVYYYDYKDYDVLNFAGVGEIIKNSDAKTYGFEFDLTAKPTERLLLSLNGSISHGILYDIKNANGFTANRELPIDPQRTIAGSAAYQFPLGDSALLGVEVSERARTYFYNDPGNDSAARVPGYAITNARIYVTPTDGKWEGSVSVQNMFNRLYVTSIFLLGGIGEQRYGFYGKPRWITAELTYHF